ncbi:hypothetical protein ACFQO1_02090 [Jejudonia soesokkakensis]|uniref:Uncharacterized protein n=1 Tax=Jejudonia soesokkakensis TaxID=1323432 RepID=A0ABW2MT54_9FLAO
MSNKTERQLIWDFISNRAKKPKSSFSYGLYFILIVFIVGVTGSLISAFPSYELQKGQMDATALSLIGYAVVLLCSSSLELIFIEFKDDEEKFEPVKKGIIMLGVAVILLSIVFGLVTYIINNGCYKLILSVTACLLAMFFWWITNATTSSVLTNLVIPDVNEATGGDPSQSELSGNLTGYNV